MIRPACAALLLALPGLALAQTPGPTPGEIVAQQQARLNHFELQLQANQLQQLQRQNIQALSQADPGVQAQALIRQNQIQRQIDHTMALAHEAASPVANPADVNAGLQQNGIEIQQLQRQPVPLP